MNEAELGFELKNALARIEALEAALREAAARIEGLNPAIQKSVDDWRERGERIATLEAALEEIADPYGDGHVLCQEIARAALAPEQDKSEDTSVEDTIEAIKEKHSK
jgi:hypothetical protein